MNEQVGGRSIFETAFAAFCEGGAESAGYDYVVGGFLEKGFTTTGDVML